MKKLFLALIVASSTLAACNQNKTKTASTTVASAADAPMMKFDKDSYNFGKIKQGDKVSYAFKFVNSGKTPLIITDAVASCGCTTPEWPKQPVNPDDAGEIKVTFNSAGKMGLQDKLITITGNTVPAQSMVHLTGEVLDPNAKK